jgi:AcrR family transcriptional regulator
MVKQDRALRTHALVLDAAAEEFAAHGFAGTNLQLVALRTGLTKGALYGHFASKAALAAELTRQFEESWQELLAAGQRSDDPPTEVLHALLTELTRRLHEDVRFVSGLRLVSEEARVEHRVPRQFEELGQRLTTLVGRITEERDSPAEGGAAEGRAAVIGRLLLAMVVGVHHTTAPPPDGEDPRWVEGVWDVLLASVTAPSADGTLEGLDAW